MKSQFPGTDATDKIIELIPKFGNYPDTMGKLQETSITWIINRPRNSLIYFTSSFSFFISSFILQTSIGDVF